MHCRSASRKRQPVIPGALGSGRPIRRVCRITLSAEVTVLHILRDAASFDERAAKRAVPHARERHLAKAAALEVAADHRPESNPHRAMRVNGAVHELEPGEIEPGEVGSVDDPPLIRRLIVLSAERINLPLPIARRQPGIPEHLNSCSHTTCSLRSVLPVQPTVLVPHRIGRRSGSCPPPQGSGSGASWRLPPCSSHHRVHGLSLSSQPSSMSAGSRGSK
jgi:hypothetical protein